MSSETFRFCSAAGPLASQVAGAREELQADTRSSRARKILKYAGCPIQIPISIPDLYSAIPYIIPGQIFAARLAEHKGLNPDRPRSLTKVTRTL